MNLVSYLRERKRKEHVCVKRGRGEGQREEGDKLPSRCHTQGEP